MELIILPIYFPMIRSVLMWYGGLEHSSI